MTNKKTKGALEPRLLTATAAASYVGVSTSTFHKWVAMGLLPPSLPHFKKWDKRAIDDKIDRMSELNVNHNEWDDWQPSNEPVQKRTTDAKSAKAALKLVIADLRDKAVTYPAWDDEAWQIEVRAAPMWKRERLILEFLHSRKPEKVPGMDIKGGFRSIQRLEARGYILADTPGRLYSANYSLTAAGEAAVLKIAKTA